MPPLRTKPICPRPGISLFEVVLALAIFIGALTAITQVLRTGSRAAIRAQLESQAVLLCEQKMNEVVAGVVPLEGASRVPWEGLPNWFWTLNVLDSGTTNLLRLELEVEHAGQSGNNTVHYRMARLLLDPQVIVDAQNAAAQETL